MDDGTTTLCFTYIDIHILARVVEYVWCPRCCDHFIATGEHPVKPVFYKIKIKHFLSLHLVRHWTWLTLREENWISRNCFIGYTTTLRLLLMLSREKVQLNLFLSVFTLEADLLCRQVPATVYCIISYTELLEKLWSCEVQDSFDWCLVLRDQSMWGSGRSTEDNHSEYNSVVN